MPQMHCITPVQHALLAVRFASQQIRARKRDEFHERYEEGRAAAQPERRTVA